MAAAVQFPFEAMFRAESTLEAPTAELSFGLLFQVVPLTWNSSTCKWLQKRWYLCRTVLLCRSSRTASKSMSS